MTRKDSEKDSERPHYYSQFWLDVAAGRRVIGAPKPNEEAEPAETEMQEAPTFRRPVRNPLTDNVKHSFIPDTDGYRETAPAVEQEEVMEPNVDELEQENDLEDEMALPSPDVEDAEIPDMDLTSPEEEEIEEEEEEEDFFDEEEEDEDIEWSARGRKKPKPGRPGKQPPSLKPPKRGKRDQRRGF